MKTMKKIILMITLVAAAANAAAIAGRQTAQQARIGHNARNGSLTRAEVAHLERREASLARQVRRDRIDGGGLTYAERAKINARQNSISRDINRLSHNGRVR